MSAFKCRCFGQTLTTSTIYFICYNAKDDGEAERVKSILRLGNDISLHIKAVRI